MSHVGHSKPDFPRCCPSRSPPIQLDFTAELLLQEAVKLHPNYRPRLRRLPPLRVSSPASGVADFRGVTGGVYKTRERIHRSVADLRLLAIPRSWSRVADSNPH